MKIHRSNPIDLTGYVNRIGDRLSRENFPNDREWTEPKYPAGIDPKRQNGIEPEGPRMDLAGDEMPKHEWELEPLLAYEQPSRKEIAWVTAGCCVLAFLILLAFAWTM